MANTYLTLTKSTGSMIAWTWSAWVKRGVLSTEQNLFTAYNASTDYTEVRFDTSDRLNFQNKVAGSFAGELQTRRVFRDTASWYNIVIVWDTGNATGADRIRMYVNGVRETDFIGTDVPTLNKASNIGEASIPTHIGSFATNSKFFDGSMSDVCFIDGQALTASSFGETDTDTGEWTIKDASGLTFGTNGYMILRDGNTITDQSSNSNNFTLGGGTLTATEDCPSDVFATMNPLESRSASGTTYPTGFHNGNTVTNFNDAGDGWTKGTIATLAPSAGKYYWELKVVLIGGDVRLGVVQGNYSGTTYGGNSTWNAYSYTEDGQKGQNGGGSASYGNSFTTGDYISFALDCGTGTIWCAKNGTWQNSATTSEISAGTTTNSMYTGINMDNGLAPHNVMYDGTPVNISLAYNFGNGYFGTTAVSSAGTNASGIGIFEYNVPAGYTALSTKGLNL